MQARYYDPVIGRFMSNDLVGFDNVHNFNRYAYANNNPYKYVDPDGRAAAILYPLTPPAIGSTNTPCSCPQSKGLPPLTGKPIGGGNTGKTSGSLPNIPAGMKALGNLVNLIPTIVIDNIMNSEDNESNEGIKEPRQKMLTDSAKSTDDHEEQFRGIERNQARQRKNGDNVSINETSKSRQRADHALKPHNINRSAGKNWTATRIKRKK